MKKKTQFLLKALILNTDDHRQEAKDFPLASWPDIFPLSATSDCARVCDRGDKPLETACDGNDAAAEMRESFSDE